MRRVCKKKDLKKARWNKLAGRTKYRISIKEQGKIQFSKRGGFSKSMSKAALLLDSQDQGLNH